MRPWRHMRIASTAKAYSGGTALSLVEAGMLSLDDTIAELLPWAPEAWGVVTLGQALHHTSGLPDFSASSAFLDYVVAHLEDPVGPRRLLSFVADKDLEFDPGTEYRYSNSDNVVVALMAQTVTGVRYERLLRQRVYRPLGLHDTSLPRGVEMPTPYMRGYDIENGTVEDVERAVRRRLLMGLGRHRLDAARAEPVHPGLRRARPVRRRHPARAVRLHRGREIGAHRPRAQRRRARDLPLPHRVRHDVRTYREHPRVHAVRRRLSRRVEVGGRLGQPPDDPEGAARHLPGAARGVRARGVRRQHRRIARRRRRVARTDEFWSRASVRRCDRPPRDRHEPCVIER